MPDRPAIEPLYSEPHAAELLAYWDEAVGL